MTAPTPTPPVYEVGLRHVKRTGRFVPCAPDDRRATIRTLFDAAGLSLQRAGDGSWKVTAGAHDNPQGPAPAEVVAWLDEQKSASRRHKAKP